MSEQIQTAFVPGLEGVVAVKTRLSNVDGKKGELIVAGFPIEELAPRASFEETLYLLWYDTLPNAEQLAELRESLASRRSLSRATLELLRAAASEKVPPMDALRMAAGTAGLGTNEDVPAEDEARPEALSLVARFSTIVAAYWRLLGGEEPVQPDPELGHAANYLYMLFGEIPGEEFVRALETYLNTVADHGMNASTFTARVILSTRSDVVSAVVGAVGALKGPLHGGAPGPALDAVFEIGEAGRAKPYLREKLERGERLMGRLRTPLHDRRGQSSLRAGARSRASIAVPACRTQAGAKPRDQRRVLYGAALARSRPIHRPLHPHLRCRSRGRLDGSLL